MIDIHDESMAWLGNPVTIFLLSCSLVCLFFLFEYLERWRAEDAEVAAATTAITAATHAIADETARKNGREAAGSAKLTAETLREALAAIDILVKNRKRGDEEKRKLDEVKQMLQEKLEDTLDTDVARERKYQKMMKRFEEREAKEGLPADPELQKRQAAFVKEYIKRTSPAGYHGPTSAKNASNGSSGSTNPKKQKKSKGQVSAKITDMDTIGSVANAQRKSATTATDTASTDAAAGVAIGGMGAEREQNPYAAMEPGCDRFKWFNGPRVIIYLYDVYRTTCYNLYEWLRVRRDAARQRIREIEAEEKRLLDDSEGLDGGRMQVMTPPANTASTDTAATPGAAAVESGDTSGTSTTGTNIGASAPSAASLSVAVSTGVSPRTKAKKKNGKKKGGGGAAGARNIDTTTINVNNPPTTETAGEPPVEPDYSEASLNGEYDERAPGDEDDPHESRACLRGAELGEQMALDAKAGLIEGLEGGPQPAERDRAEAYNTTATSGAAPPADVAALLQGIIPQSTTISIDGQDGDLTNGEVNVAAMRAGGVGLGPDLAVDPNALPNAVAASSYGGYVGADVARKAAEELAYAVAHSESSLFNDIVDDDDLEELAKEAIFYDSMHSPDELDMGGSSSGGSKKSKKQKKRAKKKEKSRSASGSMGDDEITDNGAETTACGGGGSAVDPSPAPAGGIGNVSNAFDNELLRIREQEAEKERHASVQAMTSRLIANAANGGSSGSSSHADESGGVGWSSEKSSKKSQGASRTDELRRRVVEFYAKGVKDKTNQVASTLRELRDLEAYFKILSDKLSPEGLTIQRKCTIEAAKLARCTDPRKREVQEEYVDTLKKRSERFSADCIYIHYELNKLHRCPAWQSAVQYLQSRDADIDAMEGELSFEELANELRQEAKGKVWRVAAS